MTVHLNSASRQLSVVSMEFWEKKYAGSFDWRRARNIHNLEELGGLAGATPDPLFPRFLNKILSLLDDDEVVTSLYRSVLYLATEAIQTYVAGYFQASVLSTGAVLERILKVEYRLAKGALPEGKWTLGKCLYELDWTGTRIPTEVLDLIKEFKGTRDSRTHALLEHEDPSRAMLGGDRGIEIRSSQHYHIEPFRGEALKGMICLFRIGDMLYSDAGEGHDS